MVLVINLILVVVKITVGSGAPEPSFNTKIGSGARRSPRAWKLRGLYPPGVPVLTRDRGGEFRKIGRVNPGGIATASAPRKQPDPTWRPNYFL